MIGMTSRVSFHTNRIHDAVRRANFTNLSHAAAGIRLSARHSIRKASGNRGRDTRGRFTAQGRAKPSAPGTPPHTRKGQLKRAILYAIEKKQGRAFIGPTHEMMGNSASAHEFGGRFRGQRYPARPFMGPALKENVSRLPRLWAGSVR